MSTAVTIAPALLERLRHTRGAGEEVERGRGVGVLADARQHRDEPPLGAEVLDHPTLATRHSGRVVERDAELAHERVRGVGPAALQQARDERAPDDHAVGVAARFHRLLGRGDAEAEQHRLVGDRLAALPHLARRGRQRVALAGDAHQRDAVDEAARPLADGPQTIVGRGRRREQHGLHAGAVGRLRPRRRARRAGGRAGSPPRCPAPASAAANRRKPMWPTGLV